MMADNSHGFLQPLLTFLADDAALAETRMAEMAGSRIKLIPDLSNHLLSNGGKRIGMALVLGCARLIGSRGNGHVLLAAAIAFIHTTTLLHDDVVDGSAQRRGQASAHLIWGKKAAVTVGDFLLARAFDDLVSSGSIEIVGKVSKASATISAGAVAQLNAQVSRLTAQPRHARDRRRELCSRHRGRE